MAETSAAGPRRYHVLVVEDDLPTRHVLVELIGDEPELVASGVSTGADATAALRELRPHAVVMDLALPGESGFDLLARLRADPAHADLPAIALSAMGSQALEAARAAGFDAVIGKPFDADELLATVRSLCGEGKPGGRAGPGR